MRASPQAIAAVRAFKNMRRWGGYATDRFLDKQNAWNHFRVLLNSRGGK